MPGGGEMERRLFALQRLTAVILAPLTLAHLATMFYAARGGLTAGEILSRTAGHWGWGAFYGVFVLCAATHAPIGLRNVLREWTPLGRRAADWAAAAFFVLLLVLGLRAVAAVFAGGGAGS